MHTFRHSIGAAIVLCLAWNGSAYAADTPVEPGSKLTLERAIELALTYHPARLAAQSEAGAARERIGQAESALLPQVLGAAEYLRSTDNGIGDTSYLSPLGFPRYPSTGRNTNSTETFDNYLMGISAYQHLFDFGRTRGLIDERTAEADAARARLRFVDLDLIFRVTQRYYVLVAAAQKVRVFQTAVAQRTEHLHEAEVKAQAGLKPEIDTYTAKAELARAKLHLVDAQNAVATAKVALDNAMGLGSDAPDYQQADVLTYEQITSPLEAYLKTAFGQRPDLKMLEDEARASGARIASFKSDYLPTIGATAGYSARGQELPAANNVDVGVVVTWPIFNGFLTDHQVAEARLHQDAISHAIQDLRQRIFLQVKSAYLDWEASLQRIHRAEQTVAASRGELDLAEKRYEAGLGSIIELTDAQRRFTEDEAGYINALADFSIAKAALTRDTGAGPPER
ncbi:MAG: type secretion outer membrane protein [Deltaproteobacteria bacterium]|nr:type secretion outer membrane protein [Deltaproteobacteria bacterium]